MAVKWVTNSPFLSPQQPCRPASFSWCSQASSPSPSRSFSYVAHYPLSLHLSLTPMSLAPAALSVPGFWKRRRAIPHSYKSVTTPLRDWGRVLTREYHAPCSLFTHPYPYRPSHLCTRLRTRGHREDAFTFTSHIRSVINLTYFFKDLGTTWSPYVRSRTPMGTTIFHLSIHPFLTSRGPFRSGFSMPSSP
jgi:hypothetical protein